MNKPLLVSVLIPAYNAAPFIEKALNGVKAQLHDNWEMLIVEDGSNDGVKEIVREFERSVSQRVFYRRNEENLGVSATRNCLMEMARGDVFAFLDADDWWTPEHIKSGLETISQGCDICYCGFDIYLQATGSVVGTIKPDPVDVKNAPASMFESNFVQTTSLIMMRRGIYESIGGFDTGLKVSEDLDYWIRAVAQGFRLGFVDAVTCQYLKHPQSAMARTGLVASHKVRFYHKHLKSEFLPLALRKKCYADSLFQRARLIRKQEPWTACGEFREAWKFQRSNLRYAGFLLASLFLSLFSPVNRKVVS